MTSCKRILLLQNFLYEIITFNLFIPGNFLTQMPAIFPHISIRPHLKMTLSPACRAMLPLRTLRNSWISSGWAKLPAIASNIRDINRIQLNLCITSTPASSFKTKRVLSSNLTDILKDLTPLLSSSSIYLGLFSFYSQ